MMNSFRRSRRLGTLVAVTVFVVVLLAADYLSGGAARSLAREAGSAAFASVSRSVGLSSWITSTRALQAQNASLQAEVQNDQAKLGEVNALQAQVQQLSALVHLGASERGITAPVVSSVRSSPYSTFLIGAGTEQGVLSGSLVQDASGYVLGRVSDVSKGIATVQEIFAPGNNTDAVLDGSSVVLEGEGGGNAHASVPKGVTIAAGDVAFAPQLDARSVAVVGSIASSSASALLDVYLRSPTNLSSLQYVYVVAP